MDPIATNHVLINGTRIAHGVHGDGDPVVLLHGTPAASIIWRNIVPRLNGAGYRTHLFDLLGYGLSERPWHPDIDTSISAQVPILESLLDHWGLETAHLIAHDFGGAIAQRFGIISPERIRSLTLIDPVSFDSYPSRRTRQQIEDGVETLLSAPDADHRAHFREWLRSAFQNKRQLDGDALDAYVDYISGPVGQGSFFQHQLRHYDPKHTMDIADRLHELGNLPVKLIWGAEDAWQAVDWAHRLNAAIPGSELSIVEDCGHFAMEDRPDEITRLLLDFLKQHG